MYGSGPPKFSYTRSRCRGAGRMSSQHQTSNPQRAKGYSTRSHGTSSHSMRSHSMREHKTRGHSTAATAEQPTALAATTARGSRRRDSRRRDTRRGATAWAAIGEQAARTKEVYPHSTGLREHSRLWQTHLAFGRWRAVSNASWVELWWPVAQS